MNYAALIQNRKSVREFTDREVSFSQVETLRDYYRNGIRRLLPEIKTELYFFSTSTRAALEGAAGYNQFLVGAPHYLVLMSEKSPLSYINAGYIMEDMILLEECPVCRGAGMIMHEGGWCVQVECADCSAHTVFVEYNSESEKKEAEKAVAYLWNIGKVVSSERGE